MSAGLVIGGIAVLGIFLKLKSKIDDLESQNQLLGAKNNDLTQENRRLVSSISNKDAEIKKFQNEIRELKKPKNNLTIKK